MSDKHRTAISTAALILGLAVLYVVILLTSIHIVGTDAALYFSEQMKAGILPASGLTDEGLRALDQRLADYLKGDAQALEADPPFTEKEMVHMRDCYDLFTLLRKVRSRLIPWAVLLTVGGAYVLQNRRRARLCAWLSPLAILIPLGIFAIYAMANFDAAFTLFHKLLFRNDLWLLDPATDLLIRVCPEQMFMHMGIRILVYSLIGMLAASAIATLLTFIRPKRKEESTWKTTTRRGPAPRQYDFGSRARR